MAGRALLSMSASHRETRLQVLATLLPAQLPADVPGKTVEDGPDAWAPLTQPGDLDEAPGSRLLSGSALATTTIWGVNQRM